MGLARELLFARSPSPANDRNSSFKDSHFSKTSRITTEGVPREPRATARGLSKNPAPLEPATYTVVLGPAAVQERLLMFSGQLDAKAIRRGPLRPVE